MSYEQARAAAVRQIDKFYLTRLLAKHAGNILKAAREANIDRKTFSLRLKEACDEPGVTPRRTVDYFRILYVDTRPTAFLGDDAVPDYVTAFRDYTSERSALVQCGLSASGPQQPRPLGSDSESDCRRQVSDPGLVRRQC